MNIAFMTSWNQVCGIAEYSRYLINAFKSQGHNVFILGNYPYGDVTSQSDIDLYRCFYITLQDKDKTIGCNIEGAIHKLKEFKADVLHIQFESALYHGVWFNQFLEAVKACSIPIVITYHSSCIFSFSMGLVDTHVTHHEDLVRHLPGNSCVIPMGVEDLPYVEPPKENRVVSFGLGRNMDETVINVINRIKSKGLDVSYESSYGHQKWLSHDELVKFIQSSKIVVLFYPPTDAIVSSSAACVALSAHRPVITSNTNWFKHLSKYIMFADTPVQLSLLIRGLLTNDEFYKKTIENIQTCINERSWGMIAQRHVDLYTGLKKP